MVSDKILIDRKLLEDIISALDSKEYISLFTFAYAHGYRYDGPTINMKALRELLNKVN